MLHLLFDMIHQDCAMILQDFFDHYHIPLDLEGNLVLYTPKKLFVQYWISSLRQKFYGRICVV